MRSRVVGGFRSGDSFDRALSEALRRPRPLLFETVGREGRNGRATARENPEYRADHGAAHHGAERLLEIGERRPQVADRLGVHVDDVVVFEVDHDLGEAEQPHRQRHEANAVVEHVEPHGQSVFAGRDVGADEPEQNAEYDHANGL